MIAEVISKNEIQKEISFLYDKLEDLEDMLYVNNDLSNLGEDLLEENNFKKLIGR
ncbi:MAG: hypothetical protein PHE25_02910 [Candidatus Gracilibacteria bacterium]|nr:hypothetical protein [Candidatus Gracilibacteria bacterium]